MRIPVIHIAGGEISEGAIDDSIRHAITKLASLHFPATEEYRQRIIRMGENPDRVINAGALGVYNIMSRRLMSADELTDSLGFSIDGGDTVLVTLHPATAADIGVEDMTRSLLEALDLFQDKKILFTYPNNDAGGDVIIRMIEGYAAENPARVRVVPSLGQLRYLSALKYVCAVVGNSSSGIVEVPSMKIPVVNIRPRQDGRAVSEAVIHAAPDTLSVTEALRYAFSADAKAKALSAPNPYQQDDTLEIILRGILSHKPEDLLPKKFFDAI